MSNNPSVWPPWWSPDCMQAMAAKDKAWNAWRNDINNNQLRQQSNTAIKHAIRVFNQWRLAQEASVRARLSKGSIRDKELWLWVKTAGGARKCSTIPLLVDTSGGEHASSKGKADCLASYFANNAVSADTTSRNSSFPQCHSHPPCLYPSSISRFLTFGDCSRDWTPPKQQAWTSSLRECSKNARKNLLCLLPKCLLYAFTLVCSQACGREPTLFPFTSVHPGPNLWWHYPTAQRFRQTAWCNIWYPPVVRQPFACYRSAGEPTHWLIP